MLPLAEMLVEVCTPKYLPDLEYLVVNWNSNHPDYFQYLLHCRSLHFQIYCCYQTQILNLTDPETSFSWKICLLLNDAVSSDS